MLPIEINMAQIQKLWELFIHAKNTSDEKSKWCDFFLCQLIVNLSEGCAIEDILRFCNWKGLETLIGCEFLSDIDRVCSLPDDEEDFYFLKQHLFTKGWRCLFALILLDQHSSSCLSELADLLISLFPICLESENIFAEEVLSNKYLSTYWKENSYISFSPISYTLGELTKDNPQATFKHQFFRSRARTPRIRKKKANQISVKLRRNYNANSSESEYFYGDLSAMRKSCPKKIKFHALNCNYLTCIELSNNDGGDDDDDDDLDSNRSGSVPHNSQRRIARQKKICVFHFVDQRIKDVQRTVVSPYEFSMLIIRFLTSLGSSENSFPAENAFYTYLKFVKFSVENLCFMQFSSSIAFHLKSDETNNIKCALIQLLLTSSEKLARRFNETSIPVLSGAFTMTLKVLEDAVYQLTCFKNNSEKYDSCETEIQCQIIHGLMTCGITFLSSVLTQSPGVNEVEKFLESFKVFLEIFNGKLIVSGILALTKFGNPSRVKKILDMIGEVIMILKKFRQDMAGPISYKLFKKKKCREKKYSYHHKDLLGSVCSDIGEGNDYSAHCCVARLFLVFIELLDTFHELPTEILNQALKVMEICGTCCCFAAENLIGSLAKIIRLPYRKSRTLVFQLLENTLYLELGCYDVPIAVKANCSVCLRQSQDEFCRKNKLDENIVLCPDSSEGRTPSAAYGVKILLRDSSRFLKLDAFKDLLRSNDFKIVEEVICHMLKCTPNMTPSCKHAILFQVFLPIFLSSKSKFLIEKDDISLFKILSCLSAFSSLLNNNFFARKFLEENALDHVLDLITIPIFTENCCSVFEKVIIVVFEPPKACEGNVSPLVTLEEIVASTSHLFLNLFGTEIEKLDSRLASPDARFEHATCSKVVELMDSISIFWRTYANIASYNATSKHYFAREKFTVVTQRLLRIALFSLTRKYRVERGCYYIECDDFTACRLTKLLESLLMFNLAATSTNKRNEKHNVALLELLSQYLLVENLRNSVVRKLSDVLVKCALEQPKGTVFSNSAKKFLLLPLSGLCGINESAGPKKGRPVSSDSESFEDNYVTSDEDYDADVETRGENPENHNKNPFFDSLVFFPENRKGCEPQNELSIVYPKLCLLALDLMMRQYQLYISDFSQKSESQKFKAIHSINQDLICKSEYQRNEKLSPRTLASSRNGTMGQKRLTGDPSDRTELKKKMTENKYKTTPKFYYINYADSASNILTGLISFIQKMDSLCRDNSENCAILCENGIIMKLLVGFQTCLTCREKFHFELRKVVLDLFTVLARCSIRPEELSVYLAFFKRDNPPVDQLLDPLISLVSNYIPQPRYALRFPATAIEDLRTKKYRGENSCWDSSAISLPVGEKFNCDLWEHGLSLSLWLKIEKSVVKFYSMNPRANRHKQPNTFFESKSHVSADDTAFKSEVFIRKSRESSSTLPQSLHIFSFGNNHLTLECRKASHSDSFIWFLSRLDNQGEYEIVSEKTMKHFLPSSAWNHLAINVKSTSSKNNATLEIGVIGNGKKTGLVILSFPSVSNIKNRDFTLLLGARKTALSEESFYFGNLMLFASPVFTRENAAYLWSLGPNCTNLSDCLIDSRKPNFTMVFSSKELTKEIDWKSVLDSKREIIRIIQKKLLLTYSAENFVMFNIYPLDIPKNSNLLPGLPPSASTAKATRQTGMPIPLKSCVWTPPKKFTYQSFVSSAYILGGSATFLFLFARVVEISNCAAEQAKSLFFYLKFVQSDCDIFTQFFAKDHHKMFHKILSTSRCSSGPHILKAILDASCDKTVMQNKGSRFQVIRQHDSIIVNPFLIISILKSWKDWYKTLQTSEVIDLLFSALLALVSDEHPYREFNVLQLNSARFIFGLLSFCKERLLFDDIRTMTANNSLLILELLKSLLGAPPEFSHLAAMMNCLLLLHPVNSTFVTHAKSSFYFFFSSDQLHRGQGVIKHEVADRTDSNLSEDKYRFFDSYRKQSNLNRTKRRLPCRTDADQQNGGLTDSQLLGMRMKNGGLVIEEQSNQQPINNCRAVTEDEMYDRVFAEDSFAALLDRKNQENLSLLSDDTHAESLPERDSMKRERTQKRREPQNVIAEGLLLILKDAILMLPDNMMQQTLNNIIKPEILIALANHEDDKIRAAVLRVFSTCLQRCSNEDANKFIKLRGFHHLANQISLFPASQNVVEGCLQLVISNCVSNKTRMLRAKRDFDRCNAASFPLLLALIPRSVNDLSLTRDLISMTREIYSRNDSLSEVLLDNGLLETLMKTLLTSVHLNGNVCGVEDQCRNMLKLNLIEFFAVVSHRALSMSHSAGLQVFSDILLNLHFIAESEEKNCGVTASCFKLIREVFYEVLEKVLDAIQSLMLLPQFIQKGKPCPLVPVSSEIHKEKLGVEFSKMAEASSGYTESSSNVSLLQYPRREFSKSELSKRFEILLRFTKEFLAFHDRLKILCIPPSQPELNFTRRILTLSIRLILHNYETSRSNRKLPLSQMYWMRNDFMKTEVLKFLLWLMSPRRNDNTRLFVVNFLISQANPKRVVSSLFQGSWQSVTKLGVFLGDLMQNNELDVSDLRACEKLMQIVLNRNRGGANEIKSSNDFLKESLDAFLRDEDNQTASRLQEMAAAKIKYIAKYDDLIEEMSEDALFMTRLVLDVQNAERKLFMKELKLGYCEGEVLLTKWNDMIETLTHEKAVWHFEKSFPKFWQLDPTEGPLRVRKRLARCHLRIDERFFFSSQLSGCESGVTNADVDKPLAFLFREQGKSQSSTAIIEKLNCNTKFRAMFSASIITASVEVSGELVLGSTFIYFVSDEQRPSRFEELAKTIWLFCDIKEIHARRFELQEKAIEIFLTNGKTYFIALKEAKDRDFLMGELMNCELLNGAVSHNVNDVMQLWREGLITNWEYLTHLNKFAGRSYNDLMQYPIYPFVLSDYTSPAIDLNRKSIYRNFKKPMAIQEKKNEQHYVNNYNELVSGLKDSSSNKTPYHYGSHYSNSGTVLHFLVRLPPFTRMLLQYQDNNFDLPDRTFHSLHTTWRLASSESTTDVKELIPEFFFLPEFLVNFSGFDLGVKQNGERVHDVLLPPWCEGDSRKFILIHRQALESEYVTQNLPHWIDLVFGYKQTGAAAVQAINVFHPATYSGFDVSTIVDPVERIAWETMVKTYGQTPKQLFTIPHPFVAKPPNLKLNSTKSTVGKVDNLKWGSYVGSPAESEPIVVWKNSSKNKTVIARLIPAAKNEIFGLPASSTLFLRFCERKRVDIANAGENRVCLVSWGYSDGIIRARLKDKQPPVALVSASSLDPVATCISEPGSDQLWIGHTSGNITVYKFSYAANSRTFQFSQSPVTLQGHKNAVTRMCMSRAFSIVVTSGSDGEIIIWDLNNVSYVRSFRLSENASTTNLAVSDTLGDIASVVPIDDSCDVRNLLHLHTINGTFVASIAVEQTVTAMCFSTAPEGISINVIACGLFGGAIKLFSTWNMACVREILIPSFTRSIESLAYTCDCQLLYVSFSDGTIAALKNSNSKNKIKIPKFFGLKI